MEKKRQELTKCSIHGCGGVCFAKLQVTNVKEHLEKMHFDVKFKENVPFPTPLCISHYHIVYHACERILVVSADTDVYMIGLTRPCAINKDVIVQVSQDQCHEN